MENKKLESVQIKFKDLEEKINSLNKDNYKELKSYQRNILT